MLGSNPKRPAIKGDGQSLDVKSIFATIQGEGIFAGHPAIFIRLGGCNLACDFCDTDFEDFAAMGLEQIIAKLLELKGENKGSLVVITGGEPMRQPIGMLCDKLLQLGYRVQIETNGTIYRPLDERVSIICSPKYNPSSKRYNKIEPHLLPKISAMKFIISSTREGYGKVAQLGQDEHNIPTYVQPMDELDDALNLQNQKLAMELAIKHNYVLSLQIHKILGIE